MFLKTYDFYPSFYEIKEKKIHAYTKISKIYRLFRILKKHFSYSYLFLALSIFEQIILQQIIKTEKFKFQKKCKEI